MAKLAAAAAAAMCAASVSAQADIVPVSSTIQAVDAAKPGDIVFVPPGTYPETVTVLKNNITILGPKSAVIDASGFVNGIHTLTGNTAGFWRSLIHSTPAPKPAMARLRETP